MHVKRIQIAEELLIQFFTEGYELLARCSEGLPPGAQLVSIKRAWPQLVEFTYQHASFEDVEPGDDVPIAGTTHETFHNGFSFSEIADILTDEYRRRERLRY